MHLDIYRPRVLACPWGCGCFGDAMARDPSLLAREDYVEETWRIVDPAPKTGTPVHEYEPKTLRWEAIAGIKPPGGWRNPVVNG